MKKGSLKTAVSLVALLAFIAFSAAAYFVNDIIYWEIFGGACVLVAVVAPPLRRNLARFALLLKALSLTVVLTFVFNLLLGSLDEAILFTLRVAVMGIFSLIFCVVLGLKNIERAMLLFIRNKTAKLSLRVGFAMIPVAVAHFSELSLGLKIKGFTPSIKTLVKHRKRSADLYANLFVTWYFDITTQLTLALRIKGVR